MAKQETTTRRDFIRLAATAAVATTPAAALAATDPDAALLALQPIHDELDARYGAALKVVGRAEEVFYRWRRLNPQPEIGPDEWTLGLMAAEDPREYMAQNSTLARHSKAQRDEHAVAVKAWEAKCDAVNERTGYTVAKANADRIGEEHEEVVDRIFAIPATTIAGFALKARIADTRQCTDLAFDVIDDLLKIASA